MKSRHAGGPVLAVPDELLDAHAARERLLVAGAVGGQQEVDQPPGGAAVGADGGVEVPVDGAVLGVQRRLAACPTSRSGRSPRRRRGRSPPATPVSFTTPGPRLRTSSAWPCRRSRPRSGGGPARRPGSRARARRRGRRAGAGAGAAGGGAPPTGIGAPVEPSQLDAPARPQRSPAQVLDEVGRRLDPAAQPDEVGRDRRGRALDGLVRHRLRHLDQRLHAAERLREREELRAGDDLDRVGVAEADHAGEAGPADVADAGLLAQERAHRAARSRRARPCAGAACAARGGRGSSPAGRARRRSRAAMKRTASCSAGSATTTAPPTVSECPPRYFVVECTTAPAPCSSGRWLTGVANVLSTATSTSPADRVDARAARSTTLSVGLVGVSTQISFVSGPDRGADGVEVASGRPCRRRRRSARGSCPRAGRCRRRGRRG